MRRSMGEIWSYLNRDPDREEPTPLDLVLDGVVLAILAAEFVLIWALI